MAAWYFPYCMLIAPFWALCLSVCMCLLASVCVCICGNVRVCSYCNTTNQAKEAANWMVLERKLLPLRHFIVDDILIRVSWSSLRLISCWSWGLHGFRWSGGRRWRRCIGHWQRSHAPSRSVYSCTFVDVTTRDELESQRRPNYELCWAGTISVCLASPWHNI